MVRALFLLFLLGLPAPVAAAIEPLPLPVDGVWKNFVRDATAAAPGSAPEPAGWVLYPEACTPTAAKPQQLRRLVALQLVDPTMANYDGYANSIMNAKKAKMDPVRDPGREEAQPRSTAARLPAESGSRAARSPKAPPPRSHLSSFTRAAVPAAGTLCMTRPLRRSGPGHTATGKNSRIPARPGGRQKVAGGAARHGWNHRTRPR